MRTVGVVTGVSCPICGSFCDDLEVIVRDNVIVEVRSACAIAEAKFLNYPPVIPPQIDGFLNERDEFEIESSIVKVLHTPGHTPGGCSFVVGSYVFVGDTIFKGSVGRVDLPGGDQAELYRSIKEKIYTLGDDYIIFPGHGERTNVGVERETNPFVRG